MASSTGRKTRFAISFTASRGVQCSPASSLRHCCPVGGWTKRLYHCVPRNCANWCLPKRCAKKSNRIFFFMRKSSRLLAFVPNVTTIEKKKGGDLAGLPPLPHRPPPRPTQGTYRNETFQTLSKSTDYFKPILGNNVSNF